MTPTELIEAAKNAERQAICDIQAALPHEDMDMESVKDAIYDAAAKLIVSERAHNSELATALAESRAEAERLAAVVSRLPVTADGVPIVPGMTVRIMSPGHDRVLGVFTVLSVYADSVNIGHDLDDEIDPCHLASDCFAAIAPTTQTQE